MGGAPRDCAAALHEYGLAREFFTDIAPALRQPLQLDDPYKKLEGKVKYQLLEELKNLNQALEQKIQAVKRKREGGRPGGASGGDDTEKGQGDEDPGMVAKKKKPAKKADNGAGSLAGWIPKRALAMAEAETGSTKKAMLVLKFIDGHTNAVRRRVMLDALLNPWKGF